MEQNKSMSRRDALKTLGAIVATAVLSTTPLSAITVPEKKENGLLHSGKRKGKRLIFYFTATGNSLYVARELAGESGQLYSIPQIIKDKHLDYEADEIGFVFPDTSVQQKPIQDNKTPSTPSTALVAMRFKRESILWMGKRSRFSERNVSLFTFPNVNELERSSKFIQQ